MKITIESSLQDLDAMPQLFHVVDLALSSHTLDQLIDAIKSTTYDLYLLTIGRSGNHIWVAYWNKRVLLITE